MASGQQLTTSSGAIYHSEGMPVKTTGRQGGAGGSTTNLPVGGESIEEVQSRINGIVVIGSNKQQQQANAGGSSTLP